MVRKKNQNVKTKKINFKIVKITKENKTITEESGIDPYIEYLNNLKTI